MDLLYRLSIRHGIVVHLILHSTLHNKSTKIEISGVWAYLRFHRRLYLLLAANFIWKNTSGVRQDQVGVIGRVVNPIWPRNVLRMITRHRNVN